MRVTTLFENRTISKEYKNKHGLSLYIETANHRILFDTGTDSTFAKNARKMGVKIEDVDIAVISHGHYDHGGGLSTFLELNDKAKIYIGKGAFEPHVIKLLGIFNYSIGLKKKLSSNNRFVFVDGLMKIDDELTVFGGVTGNKLQPMGNDSLLKKYSDGGMRKDDFDHEISLLVNENEKIALFCGCAHKGIINVLDRAKSITDNDISTVIGGFHLMDMDFNKAETREFLNRLSVELNNHNTEKYYTCHCTSDKAYNSLKQSVDNLNQIKTGMIIEV
jgi:Metal-dependent hydrolases of the beta-lactamase superfamily II